MTTRSNKPISRTISARQGRHSKAEPDRLEPLQTENGKFRLQVDRQTKRSYVTFEAAEAAAMAIKKGYPNLQVSVWDDIRRVTRIIELPTA